MGKDGKVIRQGFVLLYRKARQNFLWESGRPRTRFEAWIDLIMEAQHSYDPQPVLIRGTMFHCYRGQCLKSLETWAQRWGWSKGATVRFLKMLESATMVELKSERKTTRLTIVNYDTYQISRNANDTTDGTRSDLQTDLQTGHRQRMGEERGNNGEKINEGKGFSKTEQATSKKTKAGCQRTREAISGQDFGSCGELLNTEE